MHYSYNWLKELAKTEKTPDEIIDLVNLRGFEFESKQDLAERFSNFVVGKILDVEKHPQADKLQVAKVDVGTENPHNPPLKKGETATHPPSGRGKEGVLQIVCGAPNIKAGQKVPVALVGAVLPVSKTKIEKTKIRGVESRGMLCAEDELGLGKDHEGILILDEKLKKGTPLAEALELADTVLEFDILPNRAHDTMSHEGLAREIAVMEGKKLETDDYKLQTKEGNSLSIKIAEEELCPRYIGVVLENIKIGPSPAWMQSRLVAAGMEPINNVVDITNYVMLEIGSPLHAFDLENIKVDGSENAKIVVRKAKKDEKLELLDGTNLELTQEDLVICDEGKPTALAGIKGGLKSGISDQTSTIVLEAANFDGFGIRKSRQRHGLVTEAQARFEKGIAPELAERAAARAIKLFEQHAGAKLSEVVDANFHKPKEQSVVLQMEKLDSLLGFAVDKKKATQTLENLGFAVEQKNENEFELRVPFWRLDIEGPEDLMEEVGRIEGYEKIEQKPIMQEVRAPKKNKTRAFEWQVMDLMFGLGFDEVKNYSFYSGKDVENCHLAKDIEQHNHLELESPLSEELSLLRKTLLVGILRNVAHNRKHFSRFSLFELGRTYITENGEMPKEQTNISGAVFSNQKDAQRSFSRVKRSMEDFFQRTLGIEVFFVSLASILEGKSKVAGELLESEFLAKSIFHPTRSALVVLEKEFDENEKENPQKYVVGIVGQADDAVAKKYGIKEKVNMFEFNLDLMRSEADEQKTFRPLRKFPSVLRDVSMFIPMKKEAIDVINVIKAVAQKDLLNVDLFDVYLDEKNSRRSLAFHLEFGKNDRTMESAEVDNLIEKISEKLEKEGVEMRVG